MMSILAILRRLAIAVLAGFYWMATAWLCFRLTGSDPIDTLTGDRPVPTLLGVWGIVAGACLLFAMAGVRRAAPRGGLAPWLAKAVFSAGFWLGALYLASGLFLGDRMTDSGIAEPVTVMPLWVFVAVVVAGYAVCSMAWDRVSGRTGTRAVVA